MRKYFLFLTVFVMLIVSAGCTAEENGEAGGKTVEGQTIQVVSIPRSTVYEVEIKTLTETVTAYDGTEIIYISSEYPVISNPGDLETVVMINKMYSDGAESYISAVRNDFEKKALSAYDASPDDFEKYTFVSDVSITYDKNCFLSVKRDYDECYGDFEGQETYAEVFDMSVGVQLYADEILTCSGEDVLKIIFLGFTSVADQFPERFKEGYVDILNSAISSTEFYLTDTAMVFVLQPGIATYPEYGCLVFEMPYEGNEMYFIRLNAE